MDNEPVVEEQIPTVDFDILVNGSPDQRSKMIQTLGMACEDWGFFMVVNHGVEEHLREEMIATFKDLFDLPEEEKKEYVGVRVLDPIRIGESFNDTVDEEKYWRHYSKTFVHPEFHSPATPLNFSEISKEYSRCTRTLAMELLKGIWESLGVEEGRAREALNLDSCFQLLVGNLYPPCPNPDISIGLPPHSDHGLLTILYQNGVNGLQVKHNDRWVRVKPLPNSFLVNTGDHMEIASNGRYKSVVHRALLNSETTRMSVVTLIGPCLDTIVEPISDLATGDSPAVFRGMKYRDYMVRQQSTRLVEKSALNVVRVHAQ